MVFPSKNISRNFGVIFGCEIIIIGTFHLASLFVNVVNDRQTLTKVST